MTATDIPTPLAEERPPGKQQEKSLRTRWVICEATVRCLERHGYDKTSINRVVEEARLSKGAVQHHFRTKEDLISATVEHLLERGYAIVEADRARLSRPVPFADLIRYQWHKLINTTRYMALFETLVATRTDPALRERIAPRVHRWNADIDAGSVQLFQAVSGDDADVIELMAMTRSFLRGLLYHDPVGRGAPSKDAMLERWIALMADHVSERR